jgi:hypothetical protein
MFQSAISYRSLNQQVVKRFLIATNEDDQNVLLPQREDEKKKISIACIISDYMLHTLEDDAKIFLLTPENWKTVIDYAPVDFLMVESVLFSATDHWQYALVGKNDENRELCDLLKKAKDKSIPLVFWNTGDTEQLDNLTINTQLFDQIYTCNRNEVNEDCKYLPPAINPRVFHPLSNLTSKNNNKVDLIYDGIVDVMEYGKIEKLLEKNTENTLSIIDSCSLVYEVLASRFDNIRDNIKGCVSISDMVGMLRNAKLYLSLKPSVKSYSSREWMELEAAACRIPVVRNFDCEADKLLIPVVQCQSEEDFISAVYGLLEDSEYRTRIAHKAWRTVFNEHTIAHRLNTILTDLNSEKCIRLTPKVSVVTPTFRSDMLHNILANFSCQNYPNKELIIVFNGDRAELGSEWFSIEDDSINVLFSPQENGIGAALNIGLNQVSGEFFFKMDDDDTYLSNYLLDMMLYSRALDFELFGKPQNNYFQFEGEQNIFKRENSRGELYTARMNQRSVKGHQIILGNSISAKTSFLKKHPFLERAHRCTDTFFFNTLMDEEVLIGVYDNFNMIVQRSSELSRHTWQASKAAIVEECTKCFEGHDAKI